MNQKFLDIALSLVRIRDINELLDKILRTVRDVLSVDAGSIFIYNEADNTLTFKYTQNDSVVLPFKEFPMPCTDKSIAGYCAISRKVLRLEDVYKLGDRYSFSFNPDFDKKSGYISRSMLVIPIMNHNDELIAVLQLINKKVSPYALISEKTADDVILEFTPEDESTARSLAGIIGVALENSLLYASIERMWEGFIGANITAIEARDPATGGHTERVTALTLALADAMNEDQEVYPHFRMTEGERKMLKYAAMLHDFGKIGVREYILTKPKKLFTEKLEEIRYRIKLARLMSRMNDEPDDYRKMLDEAWDVIVTANEPALLAEDVSGMLERFKALTFTDMDGEVRPLLTEEECKALSVKRGSLTNEERIEIESHVKYTYDYLMKIPWSKELKMVPEIAAMHHERINGTGYPFGLKGEQVHIFGRIMAVADIYDALTAKDRPYKKAVPVEKAIEILQMEAKEEKLDEKLVEFFARNRVYERV